MIFGKKKKLVPMTVTDGFQEEHEVNKYYLDWGSRFGVMKYLTLVFLAFYLVVMLVMYRSYITYDNLTFILRDISSDSSEINTEFADVSYDKQNNMDFAMYKGELAVVGTSNITLYSSAATKTFTYPVSMENPVFLSSDKYLLLYDLGGTSYSMYTNLTRVLDTTEESVIENASIADDGSYVIVSRARDSKYLVTMYSSSFEMVARYSKKRYVTDAQISPNGKTLAICSVDIESAFFDTKVELYEKEGETPIAEFSLQKVYPLKIEYFDNNSFCVICDSTVLFFDKSGNLVSQYNTAMNSVSSYHSDRDTLVLAYNESSVDARSSIILFDNGGNVLYNISTPYSVSDITHNEDCIYTLSSEKAVKYTPVYSGREITDCISEEEEVDIDTKYILEQGDFAIIGNETGSVSIFDD